MQKLQVQVVQGRVGTKHRLGTECRKYKYRGEWEGNTGWELSAESTSTGENGMETQGEWMETQAGN